MSLIKTYVCDLCGCTEVPIVDTDGYEWQPLSWIDIEDGKHACPECREQIPIGDIHAQ